MEKIDSMGIFWLPGHDDDQLSGHLQFDPIDGIDLSLVGHFGRTTRTGEPVSRIVGWIESQAVTLDNCFSRGTRKRYPGIVESYYRANRIFIGHIFDEQEFEFQTAIIQVAHLENWVGRSGIDDTGMQNFGRVDKPYEIRFTPLKDETAPFSHGEITLGFSWRYDGDPIAGIELQQKPFLRISYEQLVGFEAIQHDISKIQDFITLCVDTPVNIDRLLLRRPDIHSRMLSGEDSGEEQVIEFRAPVLRHNPPDQRKTRHYHEMFLSYDEVGGILGIASWIDHSSKFQRALSSLMSTKHTERMYAENRFLNVTYAAEAFHRTTRGGSYMPNEEFSELLDRYIEITPEARRDWLLGRLRYANDSSLPKRLRELAKRSKIVTRPLIKDEGRWANTIAAVRNELTHLAGDKSSFEGSDLYYLSESVYAVMRVCMLLECDIPPGVLAAKRESNAASWHMERIATSIERARSGLRTRP
ncbi:HEPN domain-containing protein [Nonomuraea angiospora]|uniref:ApeA N-terminal domain 1-containing protein n=1 Tax=Nonomuraea angiospora TaxID=46172 RepID=UPI0037B1833A